MLRISVVSDAHNVHTVEIGPDFITLYRKGEVKEGSIPHDSKRFHPDDNECYWVNALEEDGHKKGWYLHSHWGFDDAPLNDLHPDLREIVKYILNRRYNVE